MVFSPAEYLSWARLVGIDISGEMLSFARSYCAGAAGNIEFRQQNIIEMGALGAFDLVLAIFVFNYAETEEQLRKMLKRAAQNLKTGGKLIACVIRADYRIAKGNTGKYGVTFLHEQVMGEKCEYHTSFDGIAENAAVHFGWSRRVCEKAAKSAGFTNISWSEARPPAEYISACPPGFWQDFPDSCPFALLCCKK